MFVCFCVCRLKKNRTKERAGYQTSLQKKRKRIPSKSSKTFCFATLTFIPHELLVQTHTDSVQSCTSSIAIQPSHRLLTEKVMATHKSAHEGASADLLSRGAILQWVNDLTGSRYSSLTSIPPKVIALLLNSMFGSERCPITEIQFHDDTPAAAFRNATKVLHLCCACGFMPHGEGQDPTAPMPMRRDGLQSDTGDDESDAADSLIAPSPTTTLPMDPVMWLHGNEFVMELKLWRWIRRTALRRPVHYDYDFTQIPTAPRPNLQPLHGSNPGTDPSHHPRVAPQEAHSTCDAYATAQRRLVLLNTVRQELQQHIAVKRKRDECKKEATISCGSNEQASNFIATSSPMEAEKAAEFKRKKCTAIDRLNTLTRDTTMHGTGSLEKHGTPLLPAGDSTGNETMASDVPCQCESVIVDAIHRNLEVTCRLEKARKEAILASQKQNLAALLAALSTHTLNENSEVSS